MSDTLRIALKGSGKVRVSIQQGSNKDFFLEAIEDWERLTSVQRAVIKAEELAEAADPDTLIWEVLKNLVQECHINREVRKQIAAPLERVQELAQAEKDRRLVVLPCKVGDMVYQTNGLDIYESEVRKIVFDTDNIAFDESAIGKSIFLTREEADAALKKREETGNEHEH